MLDIALERKKDILVWLILSVRKMALCPYAKFVAYDILAPPFTEANYRTHGAFRIIY